MPFADELLQAAMLAQAPVADDLAPLRASLYRRLQGAGWRPSLQPLRGAPHPRRSDEALLAAFLAGDAEAFEQLAARHLGRLAGHARRYLPRPSEADDLVQETMIVLLRRGAEVLQHPTPNVGAFLFGVLRNLVRKALVVREVDLAAAPEPTEELALADLLDQHQERARLVGVIERTCTVLEQDVLALVLDGLSNTEIAAKLSITANYTGQLKFRAFKKVRAALEGDAS